jgi:hypothetical protein
VNKKAKFVLTKLPKYIVLGDSHPECAFNDSIIENLSNCAQSGESYFYSYFKLKNILESNKTIKTVFLEFSNGQLELEVNNWIWGEKYLAYKYINYSPFLTFEDQRMLFLKNPMSFLGIQSLCFSTNLEIILKRKFNLMADSKLGGYQSLNRFKTDSLILKFDQDKKNNKISDSFSDSNLKYLDKIVKLCKNKNVNIIFIRTPIHQKEMELVNEIKYQKILNSRYKNVEYIDFKEFPLSNDQFGDFSHLNYRGGNKFSNFFNNLLAQKLVEKKDMQMFVDDEVEKITSLKIK